MPGESIVFLPRKPTPLGRRDNDPDMQALHSLTEHLAPTPPTRDVHVGRRKKSIRHGALFRHHRDGLHHVQRIGNTINVGP